MRVLYSESTKRIRYKYAKSKFLINVFGVIQLFQGYELHKSDTEYPNGIQTNYRSRSNAYCLLKSSTEDESLRVKKISGEIVMNKFTPPMNDRPKYIPDMPIPKIIANPDRKMIRSVSIVSMFYFIQQLEMIIYIQLYQ